MRHPTNETYLPLSRGIREHLPKMVKECRLARYVYDLLLIDAHHTGDMRGKVAISIREIATFLGVNYYTVYKAVRWLKENGYITYEPAKNQNSATLFTITKYKTVADFPSPGAFGPETKGGAKAGQRRGKSKSDGDSSTNELQDPNNSNNGKDLLGTEIEELFDAYSVIMQVRSRNDSRKSKIRARLKEYGKNDVLRAIENYRRALDDPGHYFTHRFPIERFMTPENIDRFLAMEPPAEEEIREMHDGSGL